MISVSPRYAVPVLVLALLVGVPVYLNFAGVLRHDDCAHPEVLRVLSIDGSQPVPIERALSAEIVQWSEGTVPLGERPEPPFRYAIVRSLDPGRVLNRPYGPVLDDFDASSQGQAWRERDGTRLPMHWVEGRAPKRSSFASYVYVYDGEPVARPLLAILLSAPVRLLRGAQPLTLMVIGGEVAESRLETTRAAAEDWLFAAWSHYREVCRPG